MGQAYGCVDTRVLVSERSAPSEMPSKAKNWRSRFLPGLIIAPIRRRT